MNYNKLELNTEVKISEGKFTAVNLSFNPTQKTYSWVLYYEKENKFHPVMPLTMAGETKTWTRKSEAISNLRKNIKELK